MFESSKSIARRLHTPGFATHYFVGSGNDTLGKYARLFPLIRSITDFDLPDGDVQDLAKHADSSFDFLHSSHCLKHVREPATALKNWIRVVRKFWHIVVMVPDEDMYEQGVRPSTFNNDHKHTFTICKQKSWSPVSRNITDLLAIVADLAEPVRVEQLHLAVLRHRDHAQSNRRSVQPSLANEDHARRLDANVASAGGSFVAVVRANSLVLFGRGRLARGRDRLACRRQDVVAVVFQYGGRTYYMIDRSRVHLALDKFFAENSTECWCRTSGRPRMRWADCIRSAGRICSAM